MSKTWPIIRKASKNGKSGFLVDCRLAGRGERRFFLTRAEAEGYAQTVRIRRKNEGHTGTADERLSAYGWTVQRAIRFALEHLERKAASVPLPQAVDELLAFKRGRVSDTRFVDIQRRLAPFVAAFRERTIGSISPDEINQFLDGFRHNTTRNDRRKELVLLWGFSKAKGWVSTTLDKTLIPRAIEPEKSRAILTPDEARRLMQASTDPEVAALNALVLFGGVRRAEVERLNWRDVDFRSGHVRITADASKVRRERYAPIPDNARAWLLPLARPDGPIVSRGLMHEFRRTWKRAGLHPWPPDAHRHSFISYRRRLIGDAQTALDAGTSETIIKRHYKRPVTREEADQFFSILPPSDAANIIPLRGVA